MTKAYEAMTDTELAELTEQALREHEAGEARFRPRGETARRTTGTVAISLRVPAALLERIKADAEARGVPYQRLMKQWLEESMERERLGIGL